MQAECPYLTIIHPLNREAEKVWEFILNAIYGGQEAKGMRRTRSVDVFLSVHDVNDNASEFVEK